MDLYRKCFIPTCGNDSVNSPNKLIVRIREDLQEKWCRKVNSKFTRCTYCSEDHFNSDRFDMGFKRLWDSTCPVVWDKWEVDGVTWTVQDLPPADDERAVQLLLEQFCPDETLCSTLGFDKDPESLRSIGDYWRKSISQRVSLACYKGVGDDKILTGFNICIVKCIDDEKPKDEQEESGGFVELMKTLDYLDTKFDVFEKLCVDQYLYGVGLLVTRENRGLKLGAKLLAAREPMCHKYGLTATATMFTGIASQRVAAQCGYKTVLEVTLDELAENGIKYPKGDKRTLKIMTKKY